MVEVDSNWKELRRWYYRLLISILEDDEGVELAYKNYKNFYEFVYKKELSKDLSYYKEKAKNYSIVLTRTGKKRIVNNSSIISNDISYPR